MPQHYCPVKREVKSPKAMIDEGFQAKKGGVDLNGKMEFRANSGGNAPGAAYEHKIRVIQRRAYGLRDEEYLRLKILTCMLPQI